MLTAATVVAMTGTRCALAAATTFAIPPEELGRALKDFARAANVHILVASDLVVGKTSPGVTGAFAPDAALGVILAGSGLSAAFVEGAWVVHRDGKTPADPAQPATSDIVVTGTRIHGEAPIGAPLTVIDRATIEASGHATVADYIQTLPQNYAGGANEGNYLSNPHANDNRAYGSSINLRGLGTESTLVLFDGNRPAAGGALGAFTDTSLIPTSAIDRIEIVSDGASAIYGTDAVAGVVNVRFRDHYDGFETHFYNGVAGAALHQVQASQAAGKRWSTGGIFLAYQYDHRSRLSGDSRSYWTEDLRPYGGPDQREPYSAPGTIIAADGETFAIPSGQDGRGLTAEMLGAGEANLTDQRKSIDILPEQTTHSAYAALDQTLVGSLAVYARALYTHRAYSSAIPTGYFQPYSVPTTNPFYVDPIGTGQPVSVEYDFSRELGHDRIAGTLDAVTTSAGLKGDWRGWSFDLNGAYGHQRERELEPNSVSATRIAIALADTDAATALNLFGDGTSNNPATLAFIRASYRDFATSTVWSTAVRADGPLFELPAGPVRLAIGAEHRHEAFTAGYTTDTLEPTPGSFDLFQQPGTPGARHIDAVYAELSVPVFDAGGGRFPGKLDASAAGRADWYSDVGRTINPKLGLGWTAVPGLKLRASWGTSFRAPTFAENAGTSGNTSFSYLTPDVHSPSGTAAAILLFGYSPDIRPERATSWTAGFDLRPAPLPGLTVSATYFDIAYRDRIESPAEDFDQFLNHPEIYGSLIETPTPAQVASLFADPRFSNYAGLAPGDVHYVLNIETQNLARQTVRGIDMSVAYTHPLSGGTLTADANATRLLAMTQRFTSTSPAVTLLGTIFNPAKFRLRGHLGWATGGLSADLFVNTTAGYQNTLVIPVAPVGSWTTFDAGIGYRFADASPLKGARIALGATNIANRKPPYVDYSLPGTTMGYDPNQASAIGREISLDLTVQW